MQHGSLAWPSSPADGICACKAAVAVLSVIKSLVSVIIPPRISSLKAGVLACLLVCFTKLRTTPSVLCVTCAVSTKLKIERKTGGTTC